MSQQVPDPIDADQSRVLVRQTASGFEQGIAAIAGLLTAGPIGALASWGTIRGVQGKWTPWFILGIPAIVVINIVNIALLAMLGVMFSDENDDQSRHFKNKLYMNTIENLFIQPVNAQGQWDPYEPDMGVESFPKLNHTGCGDDGYCYIEATAARGYCRSILMFDNKKKTLKELDEYDTHMFGDFITDMTPMRAMKLRRERSIIVDYLLAAGCLKQSDITWSKTKLPILFKKCRIESPYEAYVTAFDRPSGNMLSGTSGMVIDGIANGSTIDLVNEERVKDLDGGIIEWARIKSLKPEYDFYFIPASTLKC